MAAGGGVSGKGAPKGKVTFGSSSKAIKGMLALKVRVRVRARVRVRVGARVRIITLALTLS